MAGVFINLNAEQVQTFKRRLNRLRSLELAHTITEALTRGAILVEGRAKRRCPVKTGRLRASITHSPPQNTARGVMVRVGTDVEYAAFVEFGTGRRGAGSTLTTSAQQEASRIGYRHGTRVGMKAQPFLFPAFEESTDEVLSDIRLAVQNKIREITS